MLELALRQASHATHVTVPSLSAGLAVLPLNHLPLSLSPPLSPIPISPPPSCSHVARHECRRPVGALPHLSLGHTLHASRSEEAPLDIVVVPVQLALTIAGHVTSLSSPSRRTDTSWIRRLGEPLPPLCP